MAEKTISKTIKVEEENLACAMGSGSLMVLATPAVVALMENAAAELAQNELDDDELTTVGTMISIEHTSPTPMGAEVTAKAILRKIDGRMFYFDVEAYDKKGLIAKGTHTRVSVKAEKFQAKADGKFDD
ncbi:MAG: thioesterase family protein [Ruminococcus sp.]